MKQTLILLLLTFGMNAQIKTRMPLDYNIHVQGSMALQGAATSLFYWKTEKNVLSNFLGALVAGAIGANTSAIANDTATFDGYTIGQVVKALRNIGLLA